MIQFYNQIEFIYDNNKSKYYYIDYYGNSTVETSWKRKQKGKGKKKDSKQEQRAIILFF